MPDKKYRLRYLPLFYEDLAEKVNYIAEKLENPQAANNLLDKVEKAILERLPVAEAFEPYRSARERRYKYYRIYVDNFTIFYVVIDDEPDAPKFHNKKGRPTTKRLFFRAKPPKQRTETETDFNL